MMAAERGAGGNDPMAPGGGGQAAGEPETLGLPQTQGPPGAAGEEAAPSPHATPEPPIGLEVPGEAQGSYTADLPTLPTSPGGVANLFGTDAASSGDAGTQPVLRSPIRQPRTPQFQENSRRLTEAEQKTEEVNGRVTAIVRQMTNAQDRVISFERDVYENHHRRLLNLEGLEEHVREEVARLKRMLDTTTQRGDHAPREKLPMVHRRGLSDVPMLTGESVGYHDWVFKFKAFVRPEPGFETYIEFVETVGKAPSEVEIREYGERARCDAAWFDEQLRV